MSEKKRNRKKFMIFVAIAVVVLAVALYSSPMLGTAKIDSSYIVFTRSDITAANIVGNVFNIPVVTYDESMDVNGIGQNIVWVGGGGRSSGFSWLQPPSMEISAPSSKANLVWNYKNGAWSIDTAKNSYVPTDAKNYGSITVNYDLIHRRFVIIIIGYDEQSTIIGASILTTLNPIPNAGGYIVYLPSHEGPSLYQIVEES